MNIETLPKLSRLCKVLMTAEPGLDLRYDCMPLLESIGKSGEVEAMVNYIVGRHLAAANVRPDGWYTLIDGGVILVQNSQYLLVFRTALPDGMVNSEFFEFPSDPHAFLNCSQTEVVFKTYEVPDVCLGDIFVSGVPLAEPSDVNVPSGVSHLFDQESLAVDKLACRANCNLSIHDLRSPKALRWQFDRRTLMSTFSSIGDPKLSTLRATIDMLGRLGSVAPVDQSYVETLGRYVSHPFHIIRWAALQAICSIDFDAGKFLLLEARSDPHPDISRSARRIVDQEAIA